MFIYVYICTFTRQQVIIAHSMKLRRELSDMNLTEARITQIPLVVS